MIVQISSDYNINLDRILYTKHDFDLDNLIIFFDTRTILTIEDSSAIDQMEKYFKTKSVGE